MTREDIFDYICAAVEIHRVLYGGAGGLEDSFKITEDKTLEEVGLDSLDTMDMLFRLREIIDFEEWGNELYDFACNGATIGEIADYIITRKNSKRT